ncbi:MAG TPA: hypothetical protein VKT78_02510, partial [Fimbriimonadaceae bacterium]|nr:hypothetical protein [Fimbriimonadaceae bacterium]
MNALGIVLILSAAGGQTAPTSANLVGATVQVNNAPVVRLRWMMEEGWIPAGGYNLYRSDGTNTIKLNSSPLKVKDTVGLSDKVFQTAIQPIRIGGPQSLISLAKPTRQSSATTFAAMRTSVASLKGLAGGPVTPTQIHAAITKTPAVAGFMSSLPKTPPGAAKQVLTANQKIAIARSHLAMTAMTMPGAADTLGMGFDDTKATLNANYTYTLKVINGAGETAVGTFAINVGHDPLPPAPVLEAPVQTGIGAMSLHLEVPQGVDESKFGILYYRVTRTDTAHPQGLLLSNGHIVPTYTRLPNGTEVASLVTYLDQVKNTGDRTTSVPAVAVGNVTYAAQLFDSFGRSNGAPVTTTGVCKDIAPPGAVNGATATYETGVGGKQFVVVNFAPSVGDATTPNPNPNDV